MSDVYQCTRCELRFTNKSELDMHTRFDHPGPKPDPVYDDDPPEKEG